MSSPLPKIALVTGAGRGIGAAIATRLRNDGYTVYGTSRVDSAAPPASGIAMRSLDVRDDKATATLVGDILREAGRIDVLVNNAGAMLAGAIEERSEEHTSELQSRRELV